MGKQGPCCHCGVTNTPLWRNGPPEKPVLCNACGSRWRTKGSLANYTPLHARAGTDDYEDHRDFKAKSVSVNKFKEIRTPKRKLIQESMTLKRAFFSDFSQDIKKFDEDTSNRSSSGSAISNSESCSQFASADGSDLTGPTQSNVWESMVPSKKRTCVGRAKPSPVEKLTKDLFNILQEQQSSFFSCSSEEDLLFESETPMVSVEIGHGSVLIRHPHSNAREEESEASSLSVDNKNSINESNSHSMKLTEKHGTKSLGFDFDGTDKARQRVEQEKHKRNKSHNEKQQIFGSHISPFCSSDLKDIFNYEEFVGQFTIEEQLKLMKFLPPLDTSNPPDSLKIMFDSPQFRENVFFFQQLMAEGVFDKSFASKQEDGKALIKVALSNMRKSHLVESFYQHKKCKEGDKDYEAKTTHSNSSRNLTAVKRSYESQNQNFSEARAMIRSPKRVVLMKPIYEDKESTTDHNASCFSPKSLFSFPPDGSSPVMLGYDDSNQDLLLDVPSNGSFPQAELLRQA